jgi:hypothetical protein
VSKSRAIRAAAVVAAVLAPFGAVALTASVASAATQVCTSHVKNDFNGDGFADVATGQENGTKSGDDLKSAVRIMYGSAAGIAKTGNQYIDGTGLGSFVPFDDDAFGISVAAGDFNGDGCADLAIAEIGDGSGGSHDGNVFVLYGSPTGLQTANATVIPASSIVPSGHADNALLGLSTAAGDFDGDGFDDLVVGVPFDFSGVPGIGILYGSAGGLGTARHQYFTQSTSGVIGAGEQGDEFGAAVAAGDFNGDGKADIAVGAPGQTVGSVSDAGSVTVLLGSGAGITATGSQQWTQNSTSVPGTAETSDGFGSSLAAGNITSKTHADLVVGVPSEDIGSVVDAGAITLLKGAAAGLTGTGSQSFDQDSTGIPGTAEKQDAFGESVAIGDFNGDGFGDVAVGVPFEDIGSVVDAGEVNVVYGTSAGLTGTGAQGWDQNSTGISGTSEKGDNLGAQVAAINLTSKAHADLIATTPNEDSSSKTDNGSLNVILGSAAKSGLTATGNKGVDATGFVKGPISYGEMGASIN